MGLFSVVDPTDFVLISNNVRESNNAHAAVLKDLREAVGFLFFGVAIEGGATHSEHLPSLFRSDEVVLIVRHIRTFNLSGLKHNALCYEIVQIKSP